MSAPKDIDRVGLLESKIGIGYTAESPRSPIDLYPRTKERWGVFDRLQHLEIDDAQLELLYSVANLSMEHLRRDEYYRKPGIIDARRFFYEDLLQLSDVQVVGLKRVRQHFPRPEISFTSLEHFEENGYDSQRIVNLELMALTRKPDIAATEDVLRKNEFGKSRIAKTLNGNPKIFFFKPTTIDEKIKYLKSLGFAPQQFVSRFPRLLNSSLDTLGSNTAFIDSLLNDPKATDEIIRSTPSLLTMSRRAQTELNDIVSFCVDHGIEPSRALRAMGGLSIRRIQATYELLSKRELDADSILASRFNLVNNSSTTLEKRLERLTRYLAAVGLDEASRKEFINANAPYIAYPRHRLNYLARAMLATVKLVPNAELSVPEISSLGISLAKAGPPVVLKSLTDNSFESVTEFKKHLRNDAKISSSVKRKRIDYDRYAKQMKKLARTDEE